ncbi:MAG: NAD-dependent epimerase/dehydratase family protein [Oligoflexia bacterium]|nr:NAD-dependent epimerase/dehydratase family protein [Oligoflexia bacterium]
MKVIVTGGAGFIGSHLCLRLLEAGQEVIAIDDLSLGQKKYLDPCFKFKKFKFVKEDLTKFNRIKKFFKNVHRVWHLAANSDILAGAKSTDRDLKIGTIATYNVLEAARLNKVKEFVFSSTSAIYGEAEIKPTPENYGPLLPISFYGASKLACEALATAFSHNFEMKVWIYRFANIVGPHTTHGVIHDFIKKLKKNPRELAILGNGQQAKSYLHVNDCINAMIFGLENVSNEVNLFNLASSGVCQVDKIADYVIQAMGLKAQKKYSGGIQGWKGDVAQVKISAEKLHNLGFKPTYDSEAAVKLAISEILNDKKYGMN